MAVTNTLAYYDTETTTAVKSFSLKAPGERRCLKFYGTAHYKKMLKVV
jgi:hypothetical protein